MYAAFYPWLILLVRIQGRPFAGNTRVALEVLLPRMIIHGCFQGTIHSALPILGVVRKGILVDIGFQLLQ